MAESVSTVIVTGWSAGHALAAAVAWNKYPQSELMASSARRLPHLLEELSLRPGLPIGQVLILGICLNNSPGHLITCLRRLHECGSRIRYFTVFAPASGLGESLRGLVSVELPGDSGGSLAGVVQERLKLKESNAAVAGLVRQAARKCERLNDAERLRLDLIEAAASRYRRFQDSATYGAVIMEMARGLPISDERQAMIDEFRRNGHRELRGVSPAVVELRTLIDRIAERECRVLITGETGVGKETVASLIHGKSKRRCDPFIAFNCSDLNPQLLESRLFGHVKGAFTGAESARRGAFELADGGTLFLDEVGELSPGAQAGLLRALQEGRFYPVGGESEVGVDVRVIAATNRDLEEMIRQGTFREDLYYRLNTVTVHVPPLRERSEDIKPIANAHLWLQGLPELSLEQIRQLTSYAWPGNVRELQNMLERSQVLQESDFTRILPVNGNGIHTAGERLDDMIRTHCRRMYRRYQGNKSRTAKALDISLNTLKKYLG